MPSDFEDPEAALARLLKDNPDLAPQILDGLKRAEADLSELTDLLSAATDFGDPAKAKRLLTVFLTEVKQEPSSKVVSNGNLTMA